MNKLLYLKDLYNFYVSQNKNVKFSSKDTDTTIVVHIDEPLSFSKEDTDDLNLVCPIRLCHTEENVNKSYISEKSMKDAIPTAYNMPILGYIYKDDNDEFQFAGHEFFVNEDHEVEYEEKGIGVIPESANLSLVYDKDADKTYLDGNGIIWRTYSKAADIIEREQRLWCSVELVVDELSFDSKNKVLVIDKFRFSGVTILGKDRDTGKDIQPGMTGANISIADFSEKNNSIFSNNDKVIELLSALNEKLDNLNIGKISKEGGNAEVKKKFNKNVKAEVKETPSAKFDGDGNDDPIDYYEPGEETPEDSNEDENPVVPGSDDPVPSEEPVVEEPSQEDIEAAEAVTETIDGLSDSSTAEEVAAARAAYDALSDDAKSLVTEETLAELEAQETRIANEEAADAVIEMIDALPAELTLDDADEVAAARAAYNALTDDQKALISAQELAKLTTAETTITNLEAVDNVTTLIDALPEECGYDDVTAVEEARSAYDSLTEDQKAMVPEVELEKLETAEAQIAALPKIDDDVTSKKKKRNNSIKYSVICGDINKSHFATLNEKLTALSELVNLTYGDVDCTWYSVDADEESKVVYMHDWWCDKHYRQSYAVKKDTYTLKGDRVEIFAKYMSQDEINQFEQMKASYSSTINELAQFKAEPEKEEILAKECYAQIKDTDAFKRLAEKEVHFSMSVDEVTAEADRILLEYAKGHEVKFSAKDESRKNVGVKIFKNPTDKKSSGKSRYGGLFAK